MDSISVMPEERSELTLRELLATLRRGKWLAAGFVLAATAAAILLSWLTPTSYKATIIISPVLNTPGAGQLSGVTSLLSQFGGGLASLAGMSSGDLRKAESLAVLESEALTEKYIHQNDLLPVLFRDEWDARNGRWLPMAPQKLPTLWKANEFFNKKVRLITTDPKTGLVRMTITWTDPQVAAKWANELVSLANDYLRRKAIDESDRNIAYLNEQATRTDVVPVKQAVYTLLQSEINKEMLARGSEEYAFKILDPAIAPERPFSPRPLLWTFIAIVGSLSLSVFVAFVRVAWLKD